MFIFKKLAKVLMFSMFSVLTILPVSAVRIGPEWQEGPFLSKQVEAKYKSPTRNIALVNGAIVIVPEVRTPNILVVENGTFIGYDHGEFGGGVKFSPNFSPSAIFSGNFQLSAVKKNMSRLIDRSYIGVEDNLYGLTHIKIGGFFGYNVIRKNFIKFYTIGNRKFVLSGLSHGLGIGGMYELLPTVNGWQAEQLIDFGGKPSASVQVGEDIYILVDGHIDDRNESGRIFSMKPDNMILRVRDGRVAEILIRGLDFGWLYPNSMVFSDGYLFIGMSNGMYRFNLATHAGTWYDFVG